mmetsp:Transcript_120676/g.346739  ORF Transcript_120676/g.346739 Transcript_120676/m.346739 type:complete len:285 (+) Transcript_120676:281-1135(+)
MATGAETWEGNWAQTPASGATGTVAAESADGEVPSYWATGTKLCSPSGARAPRSLQPPTEPPAVVATLPATEFARSHSAAQPAASSSSSVPSMEGETTSMGEGSMAGDSWHPAATWAAPKLGVTTGAASATMASSGLTALGVKSAGGAELAPGKGAASSADVRRKSSCSGGDGGGVSGACSGCRACNLCTLAVPAGSSCGSSCSASGSCPPLGALGSDSADGRRCTCCCSHLRSDGNSDCCSGCCSGCSSDGGSARCGDGCCCGGGCERGGEGGLGDTGASAEC